MWEDHRTLQLQHSFLPHAQPIRRARTTGPISSSSARGSTVDSSRIQPTDGDDSEIDAALPARTRTNRHVHATTMSDAFSTWNEDGRCIDD